MWLTICIQRNDLSLPITEDGMREKAYPTIWQGFLILKELHGRKLNSCGKGVH